MERPPCDGELLELPARRMRAVGLGREESNRPPTPYAGVGGRPRSPPVVIWHHGGLRANCSGCRGHMVELAPQPHGHGAPWRGCPHSKGHNSAANQLCTPTGLGSWHIFYAKNTSAAPRGGSKWGKVSGRGGVSQRKGVRGRNRTFLG